MLFGRRTQDPERAADAAAPTAGATAVPQGTGARHDTGAQKKNRPTPTRREREAVQRTPLVGGAQKLTAEQKAKRRAERVKAREGMMSGDERYLGARDKGPLKRFLRDSVDTRWNIGEVLLPLMVIILVLSFINSPLARVGLFVGAYGLILFGILDTLLLWRRTKKRATEAFGEEPPKGSMSYVMLRAFQMRRSRVPRPAIARGATVTAGRR